MPRCCLIVAAVLFVTLPSQAQEADPPIVQEAPLTLDTPPQPPVPQSPTQQPTIPQPQNPPPRVAAKTVRTFSVVPKVITVFPTFAGAGLDLVLREHLQMGLSLGYTPSMYAQAIGETTANLGGRASYQEVTEAAFQNNFMWRGNVQYNFRSSSQGWKLGFAFSHLTSSGKAEIDSVLQAATGNDYSQLISLLKVAGRSTEVDMESTVFIGEIFAGYTWELLTNLGITATLGIGKVLSSDILLETGLPNFEASQFGSSLMRSTEQELERIVIEYGLAPTLGISASYTF